MTDPDRNETPRREENVTIVQTGERRGGGGALLAVVVVLAVLVLLFLFFGRGLNRAADEVGVNVNVDAPKVKLPDVNVKVPDVKVEAPDSSRSAEGNGSR